MNRSIPWIGIVVGLLILMGLVIPQAYVLGDARAPAADPRTFSSHAQTVTGPVDFSRTNFVGEVTTRYLEVDCDDPDGCRMTALDSPTAANIQICIGLRSTFADPSSTTVLVHSTGANGMLIGGSDITLDVLDRACFLSCTNASFAGWCLTSITNNIP